ncbi:uncharacterized protein LOC135713565 [Ochlerotatus camptorhynchus]|uniref:uncharacterized protein LOC135713565 n=1 Tax=Ochlerotatus camptorhynchus TaxID=644619 RepID=UPI0031D7DF3F
MDFEKRDQDFPELSSDVLLLIFDRLSFRSRLTASMVCHRWNRLAFAANLLHRLRITLDIRNLDSLNSAITFLQGSDRPYRNVRLVFQGCRQQSLESVLQLLRPMHALIDLEMVFYFYCFREKLNIVLREVLSTCPSLTTASFEIRGRLMSWGWAGEMPSIRSSSAVIDLDEESQHFPSLTKLTIKRSPDIFKFNTRFYEVQLSPSYLTFHAPPEPETVPNLRHLTMTCETPEQLYLFSRLSEQLETISVVSFDPHGNSIEPFLKLNLPHVKNLKLSHISVPHFSALSYFIRTLRRIEILQLEEVLIDSEVIDAVIENCSELQQLGLHLESLNAGCLKRIDRLTKLKRLILDGKKPIRNEIYVDYFSGSVGQLTSLKSLSLQFFGFSSNQFVLNLARLMCNLAKLRLHECRAKNNIIGPIFDHFQDLTQLEFVKVTHGGAQPIWPPKLVIVRLINCSWVTSDHLTKLIQRCPKLKHLNIYGCGASKDKLEKIVEIVPAGCFVERTHSFAPSVMR